MLGEFIPKKIWIANKKHKQMVNRVLALAYLT